MAPPYPPEFQTQPQAARRPRKKMRTSSVVILIIVLLLLAGGGVTAAILLKGNTKSTFRLGDGSVVGAGIKFHDVTLNQTGNTLTLSGTYDNKSKSKGNVYVTVQGVSKSTEQSVSFTVPVVSGSGKSFTQKKTTTMKLESAALGSLYFQGTGSTREDSSSTNGGTYPWETESGSSSTTPTPESSSATNNMNNQTLPGSETTVPGVETLPFPPGTGTSTP